MTNWRSSILLISLLVTLLLIVPKGQSEATWFRGNDIYIFDEKHIEVKAWISPVEVDWDNFKNNEFLPNRDLYFTGLLNRIASMFGLQGTVQLVAWGADDAEKKVFVTVRFDLSASMYYDPEYKIIRFKDIFKEAGQGWINLITVQSNVMVYSWSPKPSRWDWYQAYWFNSNFDTAPIWYEISLAPRYQVTVRIEGLPSTYTVDVKIDGRTVGILKGGEERTFTVIKSPVTVEISPAEILSSDTRFLVEQASKIASGDSFVTFSYIVEYQVIVDSSPRIGEAEINGVNVRLPYSSWIREGSVINVKVPSSIPLESKSDTRRAYVFTGWNDGVAAASRSVKVERPLKLVAYYHLLAEYRVNVVANIREAERGITGDGWYGEGAVASISARPIVTLNDTVRLVFVEWSGIGFQPEITVTVNGPVELKAIYKRQFRVIATGFNKAVILDRWYDEGDVAKVSIGNLADGYLYDEGGRVRYRFVGWEIQEGILSQSLSPELIFDVKSPVILAAKFSEPEYRVDIYYDDGTQETRYLGKGSMIPPAPDRPISSFLVVDRFESYKDAETGFYLGRSVSVNAPLRLIVKYRRDYTGLLFLLAVLSITIGGACTRVIIYRKTDSSIKEIKKLIQELKALEDKIKEYEIYLMRLDELRAKGEVTEEVYLQLRGRYQEELEMCKMERDRLRKRLENLRKPENSKVVKGEKVEMEETKVKQYSH